MAEVVLFQFPAADGVESGSPFCVKVHRALGYKKLAYTPRNVGSPAEMKRINPRARKVPVIQWDGELVADSSRILRLVDARVPEPQLDSPLPAVQARNRLIEDWADESLYWFSVYMRWQIDGNFETFVSTFFRETMPLPMRWFMPGVIRRGVGRQLFGQGLGRLALPDVLEQFDEHLEMLVRLLGDGPFLLGDRLLAADVSVFGPLRVMAGPGLPQTRERILACPAIAAWLGRVDAATMSANTQPFVP